MFQKLFQFESYLYALLCWLTKGVVLAILTIAGYLSLIAVFFMIFENGDLYNDLSWLEFLSIAGALILFSRIRFYCRISGKGFFTAMTRFGVALFSSGFFTFITLLPYLIYINRNSHLHNFEIPSEIELAICAIYFIGLYFAAPPAVYLESTELETSSSAPESDAEEPPVNLKETIE